jgi:hypothetical protein
VAVVYKGSDDKTAWSRGDARMMEYEQSLVDAADTLLPGRKTFKAFSNCWPTLAHGAEAGADPLPIPLNGSDNTPAP